MKENMSQLEYDDFEEMQEDFIKLEDSKKFSPDTITDYRWRMNKFMEFAGIKDDEQLVDTPSRELQHYLIKYTRHLVTRTEQPIKDPKYMNPNTVPKMFRGVKWTLNANGREGEIKWKRIEGLFPKEIKRGAYKPWETYQLQAMLKQTGKISRQALIHFHGSTGGRIGLHSIHLNHSLLMKHLAPMEYNGNDYTAVLIYAENDETVEEKDIRLADPEKHYTDGDSYFAFLTPEATKALNDYHAQRKRRGEEFTPDTPVFICESGKRKGLQLTEKNVDSIFDKIINGEYQYNEDHTRYREYLPDGISVKASCPELQRIKKGRTYDISLVHGFRKRFNKILKLESKVNSNIAEKLIGHKKGLDEFYLNPTRQESFDEFVKAVDELSISDTARLQKMKKEKKTTEDNIQDKIDASVQAAMAKILNQSNGDETHSIKVNKLGVRGYV